MQIHELNNYNGNLDANAYLAVDDGNDTGKVSAEALVGNISAEVENLSETLNARIDNIIAGGDAPSEAEIIDARLGANDEAFSSLGAAIRGQFEVNNDSISGVNETVESNSLDPYKFTDGFVFNTSLEMVALSGYSLYKIPMFEGDIIYVSWSSETPYYGTAGSSYPAAAWENIAGAVSRTFDAIHRKLDTTTKEHFIIGPQGSKFLYLLVSKTQLSDVVIIRNTPNNSIRGADYRREYIIPINGITAFRGFNYLRSSGTIQTFANATYSIWWLKVKAGDVIKFKSDTISGLSFVAAYLDLNLGTISNITTLSHTFVNDAVVSVMDLTASPGNATLYPANRILRIDAANIDGLNNSNQYNGMKGVAFGTSLTYRAISNYGYLDYLPDMLGMTFDNQGVGSAYWNTTAQDSSNILYNVQNYADYSDKDLCIIEGCVNDWANSKALGSYTDTATGTVCGALYNMISHIYAQNPKIQIVVVLDHYGRNYSGIDISSSAKNANNLTQFEFYEEIAKCCEYLGIPVIKEYAISSIGIFGTEYLADQIHCNELGAKQSANVIGKALLGMNPKVTA